MANPTLERVRELACGIAVALQEGNVPDQSTLEGMAEDAARAAELLNQFMDGGQSDVSGPCHACGNHVADTMGLCEHCEYHGNLGRFLTAEESALIAQADAKGLGDNARGILSATTRWAAAQETADYDAHLARMEREETERLSALETERDERYAREGDE